MIQTQNLTKRFGSFAALDNCTLKVGQGEVFGLLGPNGAGKSTLIRLLLGFLRPTAGNASIAGLDCYRESVRVHAKLSYLPGDARLFRMMNGRQVLRFFCRVRPQASLSRAFQIAERLDLNLKQWVGFMSTGMRQKLALAAVLAAEQPLLILDEPTANLDPSVRSEILSMVSEARAAGHTVLFSSHVLSEIEEACDRVAILRNGQFVHEQCLNTLRRQYRIVVDGGFDAKQFGDLGEVEWHSNDGAQTQFFTQGSLHEGLRLLTQEGFVIRHVQPEGLRAVYEKFHGPVEDDG